VIFRFGTHDDVSTTQGTLGWPPEAENDQYAPPLSRVSQIIVNPYLVEVVHHEHAR